MKVKKQNPFLVAALSLTCTAPVLHGAALTWDTGPGDGSVITPGSGTWDLSELNLPWNNGTDNVAWTQNSGTDPLHSAIFAGEDSTSPPHIISLAAPVAVGALTFSNAGYQISGSPLSLAIPPVPPATLGTNGAITVAAGKSATINSTLRHTHNTTAAVTLDTGSVLNLGGGTTAGFNPQFAFSGAGTVNMTAGTYASNVGSIGNATFNQTGGTYNITPGNNNGYSINSATQSVACNLSLGTLSVNGNASTATVNNAFLGIGNGTSTFRSALNVSGGIMSVGTTASRSGEIRIGNTTASNGTFNVSGGTVTVGTGSTTNKIYFFKAGSADGYTAAMTQSAGTATANGIQFGGGTGATTYGATSAANLTLSGGSLYVGLQGIARGTDASALPITIQLQGGTLGASAAWASPLDMKLGTTGGGVTIRAANNGGAAQSITLTGSLSDDAAVNGTLTKTGSGTLTLAGTAANTFTGATVVSAGTLDLGKVAALSSSSSVTIADGAALALSTSSSTVPNLTFTNTGSLNFNVAGGHMLTAGTSNGITSNGAAGSITINITGSAPTAGTHTLISHTGSLQGSGFSAYKLGTYPPGKGYALANAAGAVQLVVSDPHLWTGAQSSEWSTNPLTGPKNWSQSGSPADYVNGLAVIFDDTAPNKTVNVSLADVTPQSVVFNSSSPYTLQGSKGITGASSLLKDGSGTLTVSNPNTYTGATTLTAGTLQLGAGHVLPDGSGSGNLTVLGALDLNSFPETINGLNGTGIVDTVAGGTPLLTIGHGDASSVFNGIIQNSSGSLALVKTGTGILELAGNNTFSGGVTILNGTVNSRTTQTTLGTGTVTMGGSGSAGATFITGQSNNNAFVITSPDSGPVVIGANGGGSGFTLSGPVTLNGNLTLQTFNNIISGTTIATAVLTGGVTGTGNLLIRNLGLAANLIGLNTNPINHSGTITLQGTGTGNTNISAAIGANVSGITQSSATSTLILNGPNTYPGNLTVNTGLVRISNAPDPLNANPGNDTSTVTIAAAGATLDLTFSGTDIVDKLVIGTTPLAAGVYGPSATSIPQITGSGTLTVTNGPGAPGFSSWIAGPFANGTVPLDKRGPNDDFDNDGIGNLLEYAIAGQDPTVGQATIGTLTADGTLDFAKRPGATGISYDIESSTLLNTGSWTTLPKPPVVESTGAISYTFTLGTPVKNFARLKVTQLP
jgi:fibronectin-binding autotransporter adhesin